MKIAFILPSLANKGPVLVCRDIVDNIQMKMDKCVVYYFDEILEVNFNCKTQRIGFFNRVDFSDFDIIHTHMFRPDLYICLRKLFTNDNYKSLSTIHTSIHHDLKFAYSKIRSLLLPPIWSRAWNSLDELVVLTNYAKNYYKHLKPHMTVIPNGRTISVGEIDEDDKKLISSIKAKYKVLGTVASFDARKGLDQVIKVLVELKDFAFIVVGSGNANEKASLIKLANDLKVLDRVIFLGSKINGDRYIPHFDCFVIPSLSEGFPLALLEAAAHRSAIVCSDIEVFKENFDDSEVKFFRLFDIGSLKNAILIACENSSALKVAIHMSYLNKFTPIKMAESYFNLYNQLHYDSNIN